MWQYLTSIVERGEQVIAVSRQSTRLHELWLESDNRKSETLVSSASAGVENPKFIEASLSEGFILNLQSPIHLITDSEIFGWERPQPRMRQRPDCRNA